jgi:pyruvate formate lyase activating enzyme
MRIGGLQKLSLVDFPERVSAVIFTTGCVFRCGFCYNKELVTQPFAPRIAEEDVFAFLKKRRGLLDGVVVTGGEPTLHADLSEFLQNIRALGYAVKLDTNGFFPERLSPLLKNKLVDYVAMDIKAPLQRYSEVVNMPVPAKRIQKSICAIMESGVPYEFRSTVVEGAHTVDDIEGMARLIQGAGRYYLQKFQPTRTMVDVSYEVKRSLSDAQLSEAVARCKKYVTMCMVR